jgi:hypothetical protein
MTRQIGAWAAPVSVMHLENVASTGVAEKLGLRFAESREVFGGAAQHLRHHPGHVGVPPAADGG